MTEIVYGSALIVAFMVGIYFGAHLERRVRLGLSIRFPRRHRSDVVSDD